MKIPYGIADFGTIRREGFFFADKTPFLPLLESGEAGYAHLLFLRPRRFGKSTLLSMMEHYHDIGRPPPRREVGGGSEDGADTHRTRSSEQAVGGRGRALQARMSANGVVDIGAPAPTDGAAGSKWRRHASSTSVGLPPFEA